MIFKYATVEIDENEVLEKLEKAFDAMAHAQHEIREAQDVVKKFKIKGNCGTIGDATK